jgi:hypothetical protein
VSPIKDESWKRRRASLLTDLERHYARQRRRRRLPPSVALLSC